MKKIIVIVTLSLALLSTAYADASREQLLNKYVFDVDYYLIVNPDIDRLYQGDKNAATEHWVNTGFYELRRGSPFFALSAYIWGNPDLAGLFGSFYDAYLEHFLSLGIHEGRISTIFYDGVEYLHFNEDVKQAFGGDYQAALDHYIEYGVFEGRQASRWFNPREYFRVNPDLQNAYQENYQMALVHYARFGVNEGRNLGNVMPIPSSGGTPYANIMTGIWYSPELKGERLYAMQNGYELRACIDDGTKCRDSLKSGLLGNVLTGLVGKMDVRHNIIFTGRLSSFGPQLQYSVKFDSPTHGTGVIDYCSDTWEVGVCAGFPVGTRVSFYKESTMDSIYQSIIEHANASMRQ